MCGRHETPCFVFRFEGNQTGDKPTTGDSHIPTSESAWSCPGLQGAPPTGPAFKTRRCAPGREPALMAVTAPQRERDRQHPTERISTRFPLDPTGPGSRDASRAQPRMSGALTAHWGSLGRRTRRGRSEMEWRKANRVPRGAIRRLTRTTTGRLVRAGRFSNAPRAGASTGPERVRGTTFALLKGKNPSFF